LRAKGAIARVPGRGRAKFLAKAHLRLQFCYRHRSRPSSAVATVSNDGGPSRLDWHQLCGYTRHLEDTMASFEFEPERGFEPRIGRSVSLDHAAEILGVSRRTIYNRIREGRLQTIRTIGGSQRVLLDSVQDTRLRPQSI
jgi:excisionase family DNA binding protein